MTNQNDSRGDFEAEDGYDENVPDASELLDFELIAKSPQEKSSGLWLWLVLVLVLAGGGWAGWMYLQDEDAQATAPGNVPVIEAPKFALKEKPADPGGMSVPDRDKLVYDRMAGDQVSGSGQQVERLLPPPETPLEPPKSISPQTPPSAPATTPAPKPVEEVAKAAPTPPAPPPAPAAKVELKPEPKPEPVAKVEPKPAPKPEPKPVAKAPEPKAAPAPTTTTKATGTAGKGYMIQLSAVRNEANAKGEWARLSKKHPDILGGLELVIQRADLGAKGVFYRVRGGWFANRGEAKAVCDALKTRSVGCLIAKP